LSSLGTSAQSLEILHSYFPQPPVEETPPLPPDYSDHTLSAGTPTGGPKSSKSSTRSNLPPARAPLPPEPAPPVAATTATTTNTPFSAPGARANANTLLTSNRVPPGGANAVSRRLPPNAATAPAAPPPTGTAGPSRATIDGNAPLLQHRARPPPTLITQHSAVKKPQSPLSYFVAVNTNGTDLCYCVYIHTGSNIDCSFFSFTMQVLEAKADGA